MTTLSLISKIETAYRSEISYLADSCEENNLKLNVSKTKEGLVDFSRKQQRSFHSLSINRAQVERVDNFTYPMLTSPATCQVPTT